MAAVVGLAAGYYVGLYFYVDRSIERVDALATDGPEVLAAQLQAGATTYLIVGTGLPGHEGPASVTTLLAHVSAGAESAVLVSVPPTALVDTPACRTPDGSLREPTPEAFSDSLLQGGPACMVRAVQQISGLRIDHYLGVDLARLPGMVDALGGVPVCVTTPVAAGASARALPAGPSELGGGDVGRYLAPGDGDSDVTGVDVAERAQLLLTSTMRTAISAGTLLDPVTLTRFLTRAADAFTLDTQTTLADIRTLGGTLGDLSQDQVQRSGLPVSQVGYVPAGSEQAYVLLDPVAGRTLFDSVIDQGVLPPDVTAGSAAAGAAVDAADAAGAPLPADAPAADAGATVEGAAVADPPAATPLTVPPGEVTVDVLNGTATAGLAAEVSTALQAQGFLIGTVGNEQGTVNETIVRHGPVAFERARTLAAAVPGSVLQASESIGDIVQVIIGPGFQGVAPVTVGAPPQPAPSGPPETPAETAPAAPVSCS